MIDYSVGRSSNGHSVGLVQSGPVHYGLARSGPVFSGCCQPVSCLIGRVGQGQSVGRFCRSVGRLVGRCDSIQTIPKRPKDRSNRIAPNWSGKVRRNDRPVAWLIMNYYKKYQQKFSKLKILNFSGSMVATMDV